MRSFFAISSALAARLLFILPLISRCYSATTTVQVQQGDSFLQIAQEKGVSVQSLEAANPGVEATSLYIGQTINVPVVNDVPAADDTVTTLIFASSQTAKAATPTASVTSSNDVPAVSDVVTGSLVFASSGVQTSGAATALFKLTSDDVPAMSDVVTGSIVFASGTQTAKATTPTTLITSSVGRAIA